KPCKPRTISGPPQRRAALSRGLRLQDRQHRRPQCAPSRTSACKREGARLHRRRWWRWLLAAASCLIPNCGELDSSWPTSALERCAHISLDHRTFLRSMSRWKSRTMTQGLRVLLLQGDPIDLGQVLRRQRPPRGAHVLLDLLRRGGTGDDAGDRALAQQPPK